MELEEAVCMSEKMFQVAHLLELHHPQDDALLFELCGLSCLLHALNIAEDCRELDLASIVPKNKRIVQLSEDECWEDFRFRKRDLYRLKEALLIPEFFALDNGSCIDGEEALLITLHRLVNPLSQAQLSRCWGHDSSMISRIINTVIDFIYAAHSYLLHDNLDYFVPRFERYNQAILDKIYSVNPNLQGFPPPPSAARCAMFVDGKKILICRPVRNQNLVYNGESKIHCLKVLGASTPDGMIAYMSLPHAGPWHDSHVLGSSGFNSLLRDCQIDLDRQFFAYGDSICATFSRSSSLATPWNHSMEGFGQSCVI